MAKHASQFSFATVPTVDVPRSSFNRSHTYKTCINPNYLYPIFVDEVLPGDTFNCNMTAFGRLNTLMRPIMDNLYLDFFFFYVPCRLVWSHWQNMMGERDNPEDSIDFAAPTVKSPVGGWPVGSIYDYLGIPTGVSNLVINSLPLRCINKIYNDHFRDENLIDRLPVPMDDADNQANYALFKRGKRHDYFTSALPWPQKGDAASVGLAGAAPVAMNFSSTGDQGAILKNATPFGNYTAVAMKDNGSRIVANPISTAPGGATVFADLSAASAITINSLREAVQVQRLLEKDARGGTRYIEILKTHFGVTSPDARLQRSEYLGGGSVPVNIHTISQTSATDEESPQGNLSGNGTVGGSAGFSKSFVEHGYVIGFVNLRADLTYQQGLHRMWSRSTRFDWYWPALAHLGEQVVKNKEIFAQGSSSDDEPFGFQERWAEYRYSINKITSVLRSSAAQSLDSWHLAQDFTALPTLSKSFIEENVPIDRVLAVNSSSTTPALLLDCLFSLSCVRAMPVYSVPGLMDHF